MTPLPDHLLALADRVRRLAPDRRDPEQFHAEKSEIVHELRRLARRIDRAQPRERETA